MKISYNWLKWYVPELPEASKLADIFTYHLCEVESTETLPDGDTVFDLNILPNRAHDLLSHMGVARELSGQLGIAYVDPTPKYTIPESAATKLEIDLQTPLCRRYMARIVRGVKVGPSPEWVVKHLESIGQKSISNIVDATNVVLFDAGQPTHAFDLGKLSAEKITVRNANAAEKITLLTGEEKELLPADVVIADGEHALALAGVKGGKRAEVDESTTDILLEVANFTPTATRKTARRLGVLTDAAKRFENDLSPELASYAMRELSSLILEMCPEARFEDVVDAYPFPQEKRELSFSIAFVNGMLGSAISADGAESILKKYLYIYSRNGDSFTIEVPALRLDLALPCDMAEEIGRISGYEKIVPVIPKIDFAPRKNELHERMQMVRRELLAAGYSEAMTYSFGKKGKIEIARGAKGAEFLRTNLSDGLKKAYEENRLNAPLLGIDEIRLFEIGTVFPDAEKEIMHVAYADKRGVVESSVEEFVFSQKKSGSESSANTTPVEKKSLAVKFAPWSAYPFISRDIAVWVPEGTDPIVLVQIFQELGTELLAREPRLFDQFSKDGRTSLAFRLVFQASNRTLTDAEAYTIVDSMHSTLKAKGFEVR